MSTRLAQRVQRIRPSATVSVTALATRLREEGKDIIALSVGEPDFPTPEHIGMAAADAIKSGFTKYTLVDGTRSLKQAIQAKFARENGLEFELDEILVSCGAKQSCYNACLALLESGMEAVIPSPCWVSYPDMVGLADARPVIVQTDPDRGFRLTAAQLEDAITPATRALIINSPCNPTGAAYRRSDWQSLAEVLREHPQIIVVSDEIYEHIYWGDEPFSSFLSANPDFRDRTLTVNGVSKAYSMTGWRIGYAAGPKDLIKAMTTLQGQSTTNACSIAQVAAAAALTGDQSCVVAMCAAFRERQRYVLERLNAMPGVHCRAGEGSFYAFPDVSGAIAALGLADDVELCEDLLNEAGIALVPGTAFEAPGYLRLSFACDQATLSEALDRMQACIERASRNLR
ncbi:MAG TPA: pyridoxal phosphate-dependent aminotransferase [Gammaproteobacteria bacterium]